MPGTLEIFDSAGKVANVAYFDRYYKRDKIIIQWKYMYGKNFYFAQIVEKRDNKPEKAYTGQSILLTIS